MNLKKRLAAVGLVLALCLSVLLPIRASSANLYFTSINDNLLPLTSDTMPLWFNGTLYVPYTVFSPSHTGMDLGVFSNYNRSNNLLSLSSQDISHLKILVFDLEQGTCWDDVSQKQVTGRPILRNGRPYLPLSTVCLFFDLEYSYSLIPYVSQGYLIRIKNGAAVLSDTRFLEAASGLIDRRLKEYSQSIAPPPAPTPPSAPTVPALPAPPSETTPETSVVPTYLAFVCQGEDLTPILNALDQSEVRALFLLTPEALEHSAAQLHRILGSGHLLGLYADGADWKASRRALKEQRALFQQLTYSRPSIARVPAGQSAAAEQEDWVCWNETLALAPSEGGSPSRFAAQTLRQLLGQSRSVYLTLPADSGTFSVLPTLLQELRRSGFEPTLPLEPYL